MKTIYSLFIAFGISGANQADAQCTVNPFLVRYFEFNGSAYEIVLENQNWQNAVSRGGKLVEINSQEEQDALFQEINNVFFDHANGQVQKLFIK